MIISAASDYRAAAQRILPPFLFHYMDGGAYSEYTLRRNVEDLSEVALRQRILKNMSDLSLETTLFNEKLSMPVALGPVGLCGMYARRGEFRLPKPRMRMAFRLLSRRFPFARLKKSLQLSNVRCGSSFMCCAIAALCVTHWSEQKPRVVRRWFSPWICRHRERVIVMRILG